jgi:hypothetical protein
MASGCIKRGVCDEIDAVACGCRAVKTGLVRLAYGASVASAGVPISGSSESASGRVAIRPARSLRDGRSAAWPGAGAKPPSAAAQADGRTPPPRARCLRVCAGVDSAQARGRAGKVERSGTAARLLAESVLAHALPYRCPTGRDSARVYARANATCTESYLRNLKRYAAA